MRKYTIFSLLFAAKIYIASRETQFILITLQALAS